MSTLLLEAVEFEHLRRWRWVLCDAKGGMIGDHAVELDDAEPEYAGFLDLPSFLGDWSDPQDEADEGRHVVAFGNWLGQRVFGPLKGEMLARAPVTVRVLVPREAEELVLRPLDAAMVGDRDFALAGVTLVFDVADDPVRQPRRAVEQALRILAVFSVPPAGSPLNLRMERQALRRLVEELGGGGRRAAIELRCLQYGATRETLRAALEEGEGWDIVHFSGHGMPGRIALEAEDGTSDVIDGAGLALMLSDAGARLKLVTVSACDSGAGSLRHILGSLDVESGQPPSPMPGPATAARLSVARVLVRALDCAVVAMRFPVEDRFAIRFAEVLYRQILGNRVPLPLAFCRALGAPSGGRSGVELARVTPALFGRRAIDLRILPPTAQVASFNVPETGMHHFPPEPERFVGRVAVMTRASAALASGSGRQGVLILGMVGAGKSACALELAYHLNQTTRFKAWVWFKAPDADRGTANALRDLAIAMEAQLPGLSMVHVTSGTDELAGWLPRFKTMLAKQAIFIALDNVESLLTPAGAWRDASFGLVVSTMMAHGGLSRTVLTSRVRPQGLSDAVQVEPITSLSLAEAALLMSEPPRLYRLLQGGARERSLARRLLNVVQGHPKLIELAEGIAGDVGALEVQVDRAERAWRASGDPVGAFFADGESAVGDLGFVEALGGWTQAASAALPEASRTLFRILCLVEEADREEWIIEAIWPRLCQALAGGATIVPALAQAIAPLREGALVEAVSDLGKVRWSIHPGVAAAGASGADASLRLASDEMLADFWCGVFQFALSKEEGGGGHLVRRAALSAAPYLLRTGSRATASNMLEQLTLRDETPSTSACVIPWLEEVVRFSSGTEEELFDRGKLARALHAVGRTEEAEAEMRSVVAAAAEAGRFRLASGVLGDLINLLGVSGRLVEALALVEEKAGHTARACLGPWTRLMDEGRRLSIMSDQGLHAEVLEAVLDRRGIIDALPEDGEGEAVIPWLVRENLLGIGRSAAIKEEAWQVALDLNASIRASQDGRGSQEMETAICDFNDYMPLIRLGDLAAAGKLLRHCRSVFEREQYVPGIGNALSALANLNGRLYGPGKGRRFEERALRYHYLSGNAASCATSHFNLANDLMSEGEAAGAVAHWLAAIAIGICSDSGMAQSGYSALITHFLDLGEAADAIVPASFSSLRERVEAVEGVAFGALIERLAPEGTDLDVLAEALVRRAFDLLKEYREKREKAVGATDPEPGQLP